jgi:hypothetical protein
MMVMEMDLVRRRKKEKKGTRANGEQEKKRR